VACYLYGFAPNGYRVPEVPGVTDAEVRGVPIDGLVAVVSDVEDAALQSEGFAEAEATRHLDVQIAVLQDGPLLPAAFAVVVPDEEALVAQTKARLPALRAELERLQDLVEIDVTALDDSDSSVAAVVSAAPGQFLPGGDPLVLGERVAGAVMEYRAWMAERVLVRLRQVAVADSARRHVTSPEGPFLQWAFLVRRDEIERFDDAVAELMQTTRGLVLESVGPLPAFSFVSSPPVGDPAPADPFRGGSWGDPAASDPFRRGNWGDPAASDSFRGGRWGW
jgi:hypothetical protein